MMRGENTDSLPTDVTMDIFSRLPTKSLARFRCLSKLWCSILGCPYFTDLFFTRFSARPPRLLILFKEEGNDEWCFFTSPQHHNSYEKSSSLIVAADCHMKFRGDETWRYFSRHVSGLILLRRNLHHYEDEYVICNPSTGQFGSLPLPKGTRKFGDYKSRSFLGFDPIDKQFKLLSLSHRSFDEIQILTLGTGRLGTGNDSWRKIRCPLSHYPHDTKVQFLSDCVCINGVLYYFAQQTEGRALMIVCFDVRSEKFKFIHRHRDFLNDWDSYWDEIKLINYKGTLGMVTWVPGYDSDDYMRLWLWIMKDVENPESEWSEYVCNIKKEDVDGNVSTGWNHHWYWDVSIVGVTATGDIVLSRKYTSTSKPFYVCYINPKTNTLQIVGIQGLGPLGDHNKVEVFTDYVDDLNSIHFPTQVQPCRDTLVRR